MLLKGSCHCGAVRFSVRTKNPYPYQLCYCSICRKTQGGGGYAINLSGDSATLKVTGRRHIKIYHAKIRETGRKRAEVSNAERHFCKECGSALWLYDSRWPELVHPFASAIDSELPAPPERTHLMLEFKPSWVKPNFKPKDKRFKHYPKEAISEWHDRLGLTTRK